MSYEDLPEAFRFDDDTRQTIAPLRHPNPQRTLEVALEWIEIRCDLSEFPDSYRLIQNALYMKPRTCRVDDAECNHPDCSCGEMP